MSLFIGIAVVLVGFAIPARGSMAAPTWTPGDYWVYAATAPGAPGVGTVRVDVVGTETVTVGGIPYASYRVSIDERFVYPPPMPGWVNGTGVQWYRASDYALVAQYVNVTIEMPPFVFMTMNATAAFDPPKRIQWPLTPGDSWTASGWENSSVMIDVPPPAWTNVTVTVSFSVEPEGPVTVPAGTFPTTPLNATSDGWANVTYWSPTVGNGVLLQVFDPSGAEMSRLELTDYRYQAGGPSNAPPSIVLTSPAGGEAWSGGSTHDIAYTTADADNATLDVALEWSSDGGATWNPAASFPGQATGGHVYAWTVPLIDTTTARLRACAWDRMNPPVCDASGDFAIDSTAPTVVATDPPNGAVGVPLGRPISITFSEAMDRIATEAAVALAPAVAGVTSSWVGTTLTLDHVDFVPCATYTATVGSGARDASDPGNALVPYSWSFTTVCNPYIVRTDPADGETNVALNRPIVVQFSGSVNTPFVAIQIAPTPPPLMVFWSDGDTNLTIFHTAPFSPCTTYQVFIDSPDLAPGPVPNPWSFTTACAPTVAITTPAGGEVWSEGSVHGVEFDVADEDASVTAWINLSTDGGVTWTTLSPGTVYTTGPHSVPVTLPTYSGDEPDAVVRVTAQDSAGLEGLATCAPFTIDGTAPTVTSSNPTEGATGVGLTAPFTIVFSERMDPASTEASISLSPGTWTLTFTWSGDGGTATVGHAALQPGTQYTLSVWTSAHDASDPGNPLANAYWANFTTAAATSVTADAGGPYTGVAGDTLTLDGSGSTGAITNWTWEIIPPGGGSAFAYGPTASHAFATAGTYGITLTVRDGSGNSDSDATTATIQAPDTTPPVIAHTPPGPVYVGEAIAIAATVTDADSGVAAVRLVYTPVGGTEQNVTMTPSAGEYTYTIPAQSAAGTVRYRIYAVDADGNEALSAEYAVTVRALPPEPSTDLAPILLAVAIAAIVGIAALLFFRRRKRKSEPSTAPPTEPPAS